MRMKIFQSSSKTQRVTSRRGKAKTGLPHHVGCGGGGVIRPSATPAFQKGHFERASRTAGKQGAPPVKPGLSCSGTQHLRLIPSLSWGQLEQELAALLGPPPTDFAGQNHQLGTAVLSCQFTVPDFFAASGLSQCGSILVRTSRMRRSIPAQDRNESRVDCYLGLVEQRQPVRDDFQRALVCSVGDTNVKVANCNVDGNATGSFSADTGSCAFQGKSTATQHSHIRARCSVVAKEVEGTATPAVTRGGRKGEPQTAKEQDAEQLWDLSRAFEASGRRSQMEVIMKKSSTYSVALNCHPCWGMPGPASSKEFTSGRTPSAKTSQLGTLNPTSSRRSWLWQHLQGGERVGLMTTPECVTSACRLLIMWSPSAQLDQYAADLPLTAVLRPRPPKLNGKLPTFHVWSSIRTSRSVSTHLRFAVSLRVANSRVASGCRTLRM